MAYGLCWRKRPCLLHNSHSLNKDSCKRALQNRILTYARKKLYTEQLFKSFHLYQHVPEDKLYRRLKELLNLRGCSFVLQSLQSFCLCQCLVQLVKFLFCQHWLNHLHSLIEERFGSHFLKTCKKPNSFFMALSRDYKPEPNQ